MCYVYPCPNCRSLVFDEAAAKETVKIAVSIVLDEAATTGTGQSTDTVPPENLLQQKTAVSIMSDEPALTETGQTADTVPPEKVPQQKPAVSILSDEPAATQMGNTADTVTPEKLQPHHPHEVEAADSHSVQDFVNR